MNRVLFLLLLFSLGIALFPSGCTKEPLSVPVSLSGVPEDATQLTLRVSANGGAETETQRDLGTVAKERRQVRVVLQLGAPSALQVEAQLFNQAHCLVAAGLGTGDERGVTVRLTAASGCQAGTLPQILSILPDRLAAETGGKVTVVGSNLNPSLRYFFDGQETTGIEFESPTRVQMTVPPAKPRAVLGRMIPVKIEGHKERTDLFRYFESDLRLVPSPLVLRGFYDANLVLADADGDGLLDLVGINNDGAKTALIFRNRPGLFSEAATTPPQSTLLPLLPAGIDARCGSGLSAADLDGDGDQDLVYVCHKVVTDEALLLTRDALPADRPSANPPKILLQVAKPQNLGGISIGQADNSPLPDLFVLLYRSDTGEHNLRVLKNQVGVFSQAGMDCPTEQSSFVLADADQNGRDDAFLTSGTSIGLIRTDPFGTCQVIGGRIKYSDFTGRVPQELRTPFLVGDVDGDRIPDLVIGLDNYGVSVRKGKVNGGFSEELLRMGSEYYPAGARYDDLMLFDYNGDGLLDLVWSAFQDATLHLNVLLNQGKGRFPKLGEAGSILKTLPAMDKVQGIRIYPADLDNDGRPDLVAMTYTEKLGVFLHVLLNRPVP